MIEHVQSGEKIQTESLSFADAIAETLKHAYGDGADAKEDEENRPKELTPEENREGVSYLDMVRRELEEQKQTLDKMLGEKTQDDSETPAEILQKNSKSLKRDEEFIESFRDLYNNDDKETQQAIFEINFGLRKMGTEIPYEIFSSMNATFESWQELSKDL